jgi:hypothetical protein
MARIRNGPDPTGDLGDLIVPTDQGVLRPDLDDISGPEEDPTAAALSGQPKWSQIRLYAFLATQPRVAIVVPRDRDDPPGDAYHPVVYQGWMLAVPKGVMVDVPLPIAKIIENMLAVERTSQFRDQQPFRMDLERAGHEHGLLIERR